MLRLETVEQVDRELQRKMAQRPMDWTQIDILLDLRNVLVKREQKTLALQS